MARRGVAGADQPACTGSERSSDAGRACNRAAAESHSRSSRSNRSRSRRRNSRSSPPPMKRAHCRWAATISPDAGNQSSLNPRRNREQSGLHQADDEGELPGLCPTGTEQAVEPCTAAVRRPPPAKPSQPPTDAAKKFASRRGTRSGSPKLGDSSDVTAVYPARPANVAVRSARGLAERRPAARAGRSRHQSRRRGRIGRQHGTGAKCLATPRPPRRRHRGDAGPSAAAVEPAAYAFAESPPKPAAVSHGPSVGGAGRLLSRGIERKRPLGIGRSPLDGRSPGMDLSPFGAEQRRQFLADPDRFAPVNSGNDVVLSVNRASQRPWPDGLLRHLQQSSVHVLQRGHAGRIQQKPGTVRDTKVVGSGQSAVRSPSSFGGYLAINNQQLPIPASLVWPKPPPAGKMTVCQIVLGGFRDGPVSSLLGAGTGGDVSVAARRGRISRAVRLLVSGVRDAAALALAVSGLVVVGPMDLFFPFETRRSSVPISRRAGNQLSGCCCWRCT